jgi:serpin B
MIRKRLPWLCCLALGCNVTSTGNPNAGPKGIAEMRSALAFDTESALSADESAQFGRDGRAFAFELFRELRSEQGNLFFSPYSVSTALAMTYAGAQGDTAAELQDALHFGLGQERVHTAFNVTHRALAERARANVAGRGAEGLALELTQGLFVAEGLAPNPPFLDVLAESYDAGVYVADFAGKREQTRSAINRWVDARTHHRIPELLGPVDLKADTVFYLLNTIYFKAAWAKPFNAERTYRAAFHGDTGDVQADFMSEDREVDYARGTGYLAVALPYANDAVSMLLVLPDVGEREALEARFDDSLLSEIRSGLVSTYVSLKIPRFSFSKRTDLQPALEALGAARAFTPDADFSGIAGNPGDILLDTVLHEAYVTVDEEGTEAGAATAVGAGVSADPPTARFDRPFLFVVLDAPTGQLLFMGRVANPG